ncbi:CD99 antigen-like protein 2 isoform X1 [Cololabis saira]|uniref:CD99 antigen-like protein 2 isoform X1 n=1 Tax=Cololabis saira TaxID=129043 RepID=UPI002AD200F1|nr:CD99 antigen-like protein 2 isoform X1 [Cololabis saira]
MSRRSVEALSLLLALLLPLQVLSQEFDLADALGPVVTKPPTTTVKPGVPAGGAGGDLSLDDFFNGGDAVVTTTTTKAPPKVLPKATTKAPAKPKPKTVGADFDLSDALNPDNDIRGRDKNKKKGGSEFSDDDLAAVGDDNTYKPDKGKGGRPKADDPIDQYDDNSETTAEVGTIAGIASAVAMALVGAVTSYISYQKKKFCFSIQQSLNADMTKAENPEAVVASEPQVQQTLLEHPKAEPPAAANVV